MTRPADVAARGYKVLVVDDEPDIRDAVKFILENGIRDTAVQTAGSGEEALDVLRRETIDLIVSDYKMPGMTGIDLLNEAERLAPSAKRLLITAFSRELADELGARARIEHVLTKPLSPRPLIQTCENLLRGIR